MNGLFERPFKDKGVVKDLLNAIKAFQRFLKALGAGGKARRTTEREKTRGAPLAFQGPLVLLASPRFVLGSAIVPWPWMCFLGSQGCSEAVNLVGN